MKIWPLLLLITLPLHAGQYRYLIEAVQFDGHKKTYSRSIIATPSTIFSIAGCAASINKESRDERFDLDCPEGNYSTYGVNGSKAIVRFKRLPRTLTFSVLVLAQ